MNPLELTLLYLLAAVLGVAACRFLKLPPMLGYLGLQVLVQSYTLLICRTRRLQSGTAVGFVGWVWGVALTAIVAPLSGRAALLLVPYLLWSPVGTFVTWRMQRLNRHESS